VALAYKLLATFRELFEGRVFRHRSSNQGKRVAFQFFEDLYDLGRSPKYLDRVARGLSVLNVDNTRVGVLARRGDGSFGEIVPNITPVVEPGYSVRRGPIATIEIGIEVKIIQKAMIRQVGRVCSVLNDQLNHFRRKRGTPITVGVVGINHAPHYVSYEGDKPWPTTGKGKYKHPYQEAGEAEKRLRDDAAPGFDEFLILHFAATNSEPYAFKWVDEQKTMLDYGAVLARVSRAF
jgi:hypothetical protein